MLDRMDSVGKSVLLQVVPRLNFDHFFLVRVDFFGLLRLLVFPLGLVVYEDGLRISSEGKAVEVVDVAAIKLIESM